MSRAAMAMLAVVVSSNVPSLLASPPPNIVLMMADDMGLGDTSAYQDFTGNRDHQQIATPQMQRLARMGVRFTDAHTPSSRCTSTRYGLLTGRYPWRNRMKHWVLFGVQGDPMIERDRPTIASFLKSHGYATGMVGKWHVGLRYRQADQSPAAGWDDADLTQPLFDTPLDHGFDFCRYTSRSHGTSGPDAGHHAAPKKGKRNGPKQTVGPGHLHGRRAVGATEDGKRLVDEGPDAYVLSALGGRHSQHAIDFLNSQLDAATAAEVPFFLYYASNSNHGPYTPDTAIGSTTIAGAGRKVNGDPTDTRGDYVFENDVALGKIINYLASRDDPRRPGHKLLDNTIVIFTSDNGAERNDNVSTGPFRSNKGSCYEGGHRVPFLVSWPAGGVGDGDDQRPGVTSDSLIGLHDLFATFADVLRAPLPDLSSGEKGAEDSVSVLAAWRGEALPDRPMFYNDHKEATQDPAAAAIRLDNPKVAGRKFAGQWKLFFDASLLRRGRVHPVQLFNLAEDAEERHDRLSEASLQPLVSHLAQVAQRHRNTGGHRLAPLAASTRVTFDWRSDHDTQHADGTRVVGLARQWEGKLSAEAATLDGSLQLKMTTNKADRTFSCNANGLGLLGGTLRQVDDGEALLIQFGQDVIVESAAIVAGNGACGGFYCVDDGAPLAIYCVDADNDARDQSGVLSDIGFVKKGQVVRLDASPHYGTEPAGSWRLGALTVRLLRKTSTD